MRGLSLRANSGPRPGLLSLGRGRRNGSGWHDSARAIGHLHRRTRGVRAPADPQRPIQAERAAARFATVLAPDKGAGTRAGRSRVTPQARATKQLREEGYEVQVVEQIKRIPGKTWRVDLFGAFDLLAVN